MLIAEGKIARPSECVRACVRAPRPTPSTAQRSPSTSAERPGGPCGTRLGRLSTVKVDSRRVTKAGRPAILPAWWARGAAQHERTQTDRGRQPAGVTDADADTAAPTLLRSGRVCFLQQTNTFSGVESARLWCSHRRRHAFPDFVSETGKRAVGSYLSLHKCNDEEAAVTTSGFARSGGEG